MSDQDDIHFEAEDGEGATQAATDKLKQLRAKLQECQQEKQEYLTGWQRAKADYANYRNDETKRQAATAQTVTESVLLDVIAVMDSFAMAFSDKEAWERVDENWRRGIEQVYSQFEQLLRTYELEAITETGVAFDPRIHESVGTIPTEEAGQESMVAHVLKAGYVRKDRVIRPAQVHTFSYTSS